MAAIEHTEDELRTAWQSIRRAGWPATFEEAMAHPLCKRQIRIDADCRTRRIARGLASKPLPLAITAAVIANVRAPSLSVPLPRTPAVLDRKRAASGERDDD